MKLLNISLIFFIFLFIKGAEAKIINLNCYNQGILFAELNIDTVNKTVNQYPFEKSPNPDLVRITSLTKKNGTIYDAIFIQINLNNYEADLIRTFNLDISDQKISKKLKRLESYDLVSNLENKQTYKLSCKEIDKIDNQSSDFIKIYNCSNSEQKISSKITLVKEIDSESYIISELYEDENGLYDEILYYAGKVSGNQIMFMDFWEEEKMAMYATIYENINSKQIKLMYLNIKVDDQIINYLKKNKSNINKLPLDQLNKISFNLKTEQSLHKYYRNLFDNLLNSTDVEYYESELICN